MVEGLRACPALLHISGVQPALETVARSFLQVTEVRAHGRQEADSQGPLLADHTSAWLQLTALQR